MFALLGMGGVAEAQTPKQTVVDGVAVSDFKMERNGGYMAVDMMLDLSDLDIESNRAVLLTPRLVNGADSLDLPAVGIYGRRRYYFYVRHGESMLSGSDEQSYKASKAPDSLLYNNVLPYAEWMNGATLSLHREDYGCCHTLLAEQDGPLGRHLEEFFPTLVYVSPVAERVKSRSLEGSAYIDFPVNKTVIYPDYRRNTVELGKIQATIDSVRDDRDVTITSVWLKGYASPESPYVHNEKLAVGRTAALKQYICQLYRFNDTIIQTDHEPEDWAGLRRYVEQTNLAHKSEILALIDSDMEPDAKEWKIKASYPTDYAFLLKEVYPGLRHSDYSVMYEVRAYTDVEEIKRIMKIAPQKLSLQELYLAAQQMEAGSDEYNETFEIAVRMFPDDATANQNAANAAMGKGDMTNAERYLSKAGDTPEATYSRGIYAALSGDYGKAENLFEEAERGGVTEAAEALNQIRELKNDQIP